MPTSTPTRKRRRKKKEEPIKEEHLIPGIMAQANKKYPEARGMPVVKFLFSTGDEEDRHRFRVNWIRDGVVTFSVYVLAYAEGDAVTCVWRT